MSAPPLPAPLSLVAHAIGLKVAIDVRNRSAGDAELDRLLDALADAEHQLRQITERKDHHP